MSVILAFIAANYVPISAIAYELAVRIFPTTRDLSIINLAKNISDTIVKNKSKDGGSF